MLLELCARSGCWKREKMLEHALAVCEQDHSARNAWSRVLLIIGQNIVRRVLQCPA